ncbi:YHS domain protein [bacterium BMS3Bbin14]|nr:YHS domain protein [bacterium BMS3Abin13]GBE52602.1 YHS domain protein [bacterium BMS3Bbin14]HDK44124.1 YHS domain-containing protein [Desulfobacteraceae bacterium]HDO30967.1 YHS domain-containing protein [Desulfobacteraceae bacterium]
MIRFVVLAVLFYLAWRLLNGIIRNPSVRADKDSGPAAEDPPVQDVLVEDPVCHTLVPKHQAIRLRQDGTTYYFCSEACCDKFTDKPKEDE